ncbi:hypothetical protein VTL71DRAFT_11899 [Oculimacula yallundae]|uniref:Uncharacterized protein n=1 Tax=Oculimacula yallundae TaxID=86028 RepID=A0ABR4CTS8_9HELO
MPGPRLPVVPPYPHRPWAAVTAVLFCSLLADRGLEAKQPALLQPPTFHHAKPFFLYRQPVSLLFFWIIFDLCFLFIAFRSSSVL